MDLSEQLQKMAGRPAGKKVTIEFNIDELAFIAGAIRFITETNKRSKKEFLNMAKSMNGQLDASMILLKIITKCEKDFKERAKELKDAIKEIE